MFFFHFKPSSSAYINRCSTFVLSCILCVMRKSAMCTLPYTYVSNCFGCMCLCWTFPYPTRFDSTFSSPIPG